jgi:signal transduction histidine kinase
MGLGLQICRSIAEHHDGRLWACDREGGGTIFHCSFPASRP